jgi:hypothetical protein
VTIPTAAEIAEAHAAILREGPQAQTTIDLCAAIVTDPIAASIAGKIAHSIGDRWGLSALLGAFASGMNHGLRIGEARAARGGGQ